MIRNSCHLAVSRARTELCRAEPQLSMGWHNVIRQRMNLLPTLRALGKQFAVNAPTAFPPPSLFLIRDGLPDHVCNIWGQYLGIAVGTTVTGRPPHRSVREGLPHTAPPSGQTITNKFRYQSSLSCHANDAKSGAVSGTSMTVRQYFPSVTPFPRRTPPLRLQLCSPASTVLWSHLTSQQRAC